jgi:DNA repair protein RadC
MPRRTTPKPTIRTPLDVVALSQRHAQLPHEELRCFYLDKQQQLLHHRTVARGSVDHSSIQPRSVFLPGLLISSAGVILVHNHPSGDPLPSQEDIAVTQLLTTAGSILGVGILDHIIVTRDDYSSLRALGMLE